MKAAADMTPKARRTEAAGLLQRLAAVATDMGDKGYTLGIADRMLEGTASAEPEYLEGLRERTASAEAVAQARRDAAALALREDGYATPAQLADLFAGGLVTRASRVEGHELTALGLAAAQRAEDAWRALTKL